MIGMLDIGFGFNVQISKIYAIIPYGGSASRALVKYIGRNNDFNIIKCTRGRKARSVILMDNEIAFVSPLDLNDLALNLEKTRSLDVKHEL